MPGVVIKWAYRHYVLNAEEFDSLDEAVGAAGAAADYGIEALHSIEVVGPEPRVLSPVEVDALLAPAREREHEEIMAKPLPLAEIRLVSPDGTEARYEVFMSLADAEADAARLVQLLGSDRVKVLKR